MLWCLDHCNSVCRGLSFIYGPIMSSSTEFIFTFNAWYLTVQFLFSLPIDSARPISTVHIVELVFKSTRQFQIFNSWSSWEVYQLDICDRASLLRLTHSNQVFAGTCIRKCIRIPFTRPYSVRIPLIMLQIATAINLQSHIRWSLSMIVASVLWFQWVIHKPLPRQPGGEARSLIQQ